VTRELEALALAAERRAVEVQRTAVEEAAELARQEFTKRDTLYDELKRHCDFCTKVRASVHSILARVQAVVWRFACIVYPEKTLTLVGGICGRQGTADEVVQMWQYVQRIDGDVRDVVLRLDNRMAKIYGRTWK
jgi:hypothetical protein